MIGVGLPRFVAYSALSALLWAGTWGGLGYFAGEALQRVTDQSEHVGRILLASVVAGLVVYLLVKWTQRQRFLRSLRAARISQEALKEHLDSGEPIVIVDLRSELDARAVPLDHPGVAADGPRGARGTPSGDPAGPGRCPVLLLTERGDERPGGAGSATTRGDPGETPGGWLPGVARARVPGGTTAVPRAVTDRSWRLCVEDVDAFGKRACMNERRVDRRSIRDVDPVRRRSTC
jgi:hypothetical protein